MDDVMKLKPVTYNWKREGYENKTRIGFIAQEVQQIIEEVVRSEDYQLIDEKTGAHEWQPVKNLGVAYSELIPVLVAGMQEQQNIIEEKEKQISKLEGRLEKIEAALKLN